MIIQCPNCLTKFKMDDSKVKDEGTKVRCAKCKEVFVVTKEEAAPTPPPAAPELPTEKEEFDFSFGSSAKENEESASGFGGGFEEEAPKEEEAGFDFGAFSGGETKEDGLEWGGMAYGEVNLSGSDEAKPSEQKEAPSGFEFKEEETPFEAPSLSSTVVIPPLSPPVEERAGFGEGTPGTLVFEEKEPLGSFEEESFPDEFAIETKKETRQSFLRIVISVVVICAVAAVPFWYFWKNHQGAETGEITLSDLNGYYTQNAEAGNVFVVSGKAVNNTNKSRSFFQVRGILFGKKGEKLTQKEVYCGNIFTAREITTLPRTKIEADLKNKVGSSLSNINLATGKSVPFMIVFFDLPADMSEFSVEVTGSQIASE